PEWARGAGAASCWQRCGRWPGASSCCLPCRAVGVAAARRADRDLVRDTGRLNHSRQPDLALAATPDPPGTREVHARSMRGASRKSSAGRHPSWLNLDSAQVSSRQVHGCTDPRAVARAPGCPDRPARSRMCAGVPQAPVPVHGVRLVVVGGLPAPVLRAARRDHVPGAAVPRPALAARRPGGRDAAGRHAPAGGHGGAGSRRCPHNRRALSQARHRAPARLRPRRRRRPCRGARSTFVSAATLDGLIDTLVAARHAGGYRYDFPERVLRQFAGHCRREGYAGGSIVKEAVEEFLYGRHLKAATIRREEIVLRELAEHARQFGWHAWAPPALTAVKKPHRPPPYVFSDEEIRRLFRV